MTPAASPDDHVIHYALTRREWLRTEYPALLLWVGWAALLLSGVVAAASHSAAWWLLLLPWWFLGGARATALLLLVFRGPDRVTLRVRADGIIFAAEDDAEPVYCHWQAFVDLGDTLLLWGADGRYRVVIPKRALTAADYTALRERTGVALDTLAPNQEARLPAPSSQSLEPR